MSRNKREGWYAGKYRGKHIRAGWFTATFRGRMKLRLRK